MNHWSRGDRPDELAQIVNAAFLDMTDARLDHDDERLKRALAEALVAVEGYCALRREHGDHVLFPSLTSCTPDGLRLLAAAAILALDERGFVIDGDSARRQTPLVGTSRHAPGRRQMP